MSRPFVVVGGGSWGTALALHASRVAESVGLWILEEELERDIAATRENSVYLPGYRLPDNVHTTSDLEAAVGEAARLLLVVPSHHLRSVLRSCAGRIGPDVDLLVATKGIENETLQRMSEVVASETGLDRSRIASLSGPSFAREVAEGHPTAVVVAALDDELGRRLQRDLSGGSLRIYRNPDQTGVELGGALKNVVALAAGMLEGLGYGHNTAAALLTRGLHEITRLAVALGGQRSTLAGLAGLGDLVLTCTGGLSRNRQVGVELGRGRKLSEILGGMKMVAEGVRTAEAARDLARREGVEMPITERVNAVLFDDVPPEEAIRDLLARELKDESAL